MSCEEGERKKWVQANASRNGFTAAQGSEQWLEAQSAYRRAVQETGPRSEQQQEQDELASLVLNQLLKSEDLRLFRPSHMQGDLPSQSVQRGYAAFLAQAIASGNVTSGDMILASRDARSADVRANMRSIAVRINAAQLKRRAAEFVTKQRVPPERVLARPRTMVDEMSNKYFDGSGSVNWESPGVVRQRMRERFGRDLTAGEILDLTGAPSGSTVWVTANEPSDFDDPDYDHPLAADGIRCIVTHPLLVGQSQRNIDVNANGKLSIYNDGLLIQPDAPNGMGTRMLAQQVLAARKMDGEGIRMDAAKSDKFNGYYTWPRMGCDMPITQRKELGNDLRHCNTTNDLMLCDGGADWWRKHGTGGHAELAFNNEVSMHVWRAYTESKGIVFADE